jgi:hypothetical protein
VGRGARSPVPLSRWRAPDDTIPEPPGAPPKPEPEPEPEPEPPPAPVFVCPQYSPVSYGEWMEEFKKLVEVYKNTEHNPGHLDPSPTDVNHWGWRRFIELWTYEDIAADIAHPGSVTDAFCKAAPSS